MYKKLIESSLKKAAKVDKVELEIPANPAYGDFSTNIGLKKGNPKEIKKRLTKDKSLSQIVSKIEIKEGFINFWLSKEALINNLDKILKQKDNYGKDEIGKGKRVVIDYSSPNIAKHFSIGHLRSTIIGQAVYNLYTALGFDTVGDNHLGDWGTQFGMILSAIEEKRINPDSLTLNDLEEIYVAYSKKAKENPALKEKAKDWFKRLENKDKKARQIWEIVNKISLAEYQKIYDLLDIKIDYAYGESFYEDEMVKVISLARSKKLIKKSQGALIIDLGKDLPPAMLVKSDGTTTYLTRDLAAIDFRLKKWNPSLIIYEVGSEQKLHFRQVFKAAELLGWAKKTNFVHIAHGLVLIGGKKMSTRSGTTIKLEEILEKAIEKAAELLNSAKVVKNLNPKEKEAIIKDVGIGAVKYFDLMHHPESEINFDWNSIFNLKGNSGPYLQYTYARTQSIINKSQISNFKFQTNSNNQNTKPQNRLNSKNLELDNCLDFGAWNLEFNREELSLLRSLSQYQDILVNAAKNYSPNILCSYLFDLAQKYNTFYSKHRVLDISNKSSVISQFRLAITAATGTVLKNGLLLLGINAPEKM